MSRARPPKTRGFTLVELIVVVAISGVIAAVVGVFILRPVQGYEALNRRAMLVDQAEAALRRMQREVRRALPNSVRVAPEGNGNGQVLELLPVVDGGRYREGPPGDAAALLDFAAADTSFDAVGRLLCTTNPAVTGACATYGGYRVVIYNLGQPGGDAYANSDVIAAGSTLTVASGAGADGSDRIGLAPGFQFRFRSLRQRFFVVDAPIAYVCDTANRTLTRYAGHARRANQAEVDTAAELLAQGAQAARVTDNVAACAITYTAGTPERAGIVTFDLTVTDAPTGERVRLLHQVHVDNAP